MFWKMWGAWGHRSLYSVTGLLCALLALSLLPNVNSSPGVSPAPPASSTSASGLRPSAGGKENNSSTAVEGPLSTVPAGPPPNKPRTQRALAVLVVVSAAVIIYFVIRTIRTRRKHKKTRKYGVLDTNIGNMELTPLEQEEEDDDTLFDANHPRR
ncbi:membrane protein FAM174A [Spea bombifrons]|uniref:membrane protein FAM174A n=1 Tax=Spea bombifrons TaxID=233779 RepID=UPI00234B6A52|nr:membrane protein FAM174A [Spea bombifrons]